MYNFLIKEDHEFLFITTLKYAQLIQPIPDNTKQTKQTSETSIVKTNYKHMLLFAHKQTSETSIVKTNYKHMLLFAHKQTSETSIVKQTEREGGR